MPTITSTARATIGGDSSAPRTHRPTIAASTGMNMPEKTEAVTPTQEASKSGQLDTTEDTASKAVTLSPQLTALARKQQKLQQEVQAQRDKEAEWAKKEADYVPKSSIKAKLQQNAAEALKDLGLDYEELTNLMIAQQNGDDPVKRLESKITQLEKSQEENVNKQYEATIKQYKAEANAVIAKDPKKYFLVGKKGQQDAVVQHIVETWEENPDQVLTVEEAAADIEDFLREEAKENKALLEELEGPKEVLQEQAQKKLPPPRSGARTLTQQVESTPTRTYNQFQHLSMKDRIAQAVARSRK